MPSAYSAWAFLLSAKSRGFSFSRKFWVCTKTGHAHHMYSQPPCVNIGRVRTWWTRATLPLAPSHMYGMPHPNYNHVA